MVAVLVWPGDSATFLFKYTEYVGSGVQRPVNILYDRELPFFLHHWMSNIMNLVLIENGLRFFSPSF
jgi:hypothetical protein